MDCCHDMAREASATVAAHYPKTALKAGSTELEAETHPVSSKDEASIGGYVAGQDLVVIALSGFSDSSKNPELPRTCGQVAVSLLSSQNKPYLYVRRPLPSSSFLPQAGIEKTWECPTGWWRSPPQGGE